MKAPTIWRLITRLIGAACIIGGAVLWNTRLDFSPEDALQKNSQLEIIPLDSQSTSKITDACNIGARKGGWILFFITASLASDNTTRRIFDTAEDELGLYLSYNPEDSALLRAGLTSNGVTKFVPIRTVRSDEDAFIAIGIRQNKVRLITNAVDKTFQWPDLKVPQLQCDAVRPRTSDEAVCEDCSVTARYVVGSGTKELNQIMDSLSNRQAFETNRWLGNGLIIFGIFICSGIILKSKRC